MTGVGSATLEPMAGARRPFEKTCRKIKARRRTHAPRQTVERSARIPLIRVGALDRPGPGDVPDAGRGLDCSAVHEPDLHVARIVAPENVALPVAVEVSGADDRPAAGHIAEAERGGDRGTVHQPDHRLPAGAVAPEDVA